MSRVSIFANGTVLKKFWISAEITDFFLRDGGIITAKTKEGDINDEQKNSGICSGSVSFGSDSLRGFCGGCNGDFAQDGGQGFQQKLHGDA